MVSKCANPACSASFRYLHEGRIFSIYSASPGRLPDWGEHGSNVERYWLCPACARDMTLVLRQGHVVVQKFPAVAPRLRAA